MVKRATRVRSNPEQKRAEILDEAMRIIGECGYNSFSIRALATRCNLTNAGLLHYFGSKEALLVALLEDRDERESAELIRLVGIQTATTKQQRACQLKTALKEIVRRNSLQPELVRLSVLLGAESLIVGHPAQAYFTAKEKTILKLFSESLQGVFAEPDSKARQILAALYGLEIQWLRCDCHFDLVAEWEKVLEHIFPLQA